MKKVFPTLFASLIASAAFAQVPATTSQTEAPKPEPAKPVRSSIRPEPDIAGPASPGDKAASETKKTAKHKKANTHKKAAKIDNAHGEKTGPAAQTR